MEKVTLGVRCASLLLGMDLPFETMVQSLMRDLDLNHDQAAAAVLTAQSVAAKASAPARVH